MKNFNSQLFKILFILVPLLWSMELHAKSGEVTRSNSTFTAKVDGVTVYSGSDMIAAIQAAVDNLTAGRTVKETVTVKNSGSTGAHAWDGDLKCVNLPGYTILDFLGTTMNVNDDTDNTIVPIRARSVTDIEIKNLRITGNPRYGIWIQSCSNVTLSQINISIAEATTVGLGIRVDDARGPWSTNVSLDYAYVENAKHHGLETYGVDGLTIGTVETRNTGGCGLILNKTKNATVGTVNSYRANYGGGYAALRLANMAGPNIKVDKVIARECGRGVFSVSGSNGITINSVDIAGSTGHGMLIENAQNFWVKGGVIANCGSEGVRITSRSDNQFLPSQYNTVENLRVYGCTYGVRETLPYTNNNKILYNDLGGNTNCLYYEGAGTVATGNLCTSMEGTYVISPRHSGKALDVYGFSTDNGGNIVQWAKSGSNNQKWKVTYVGSGYYKVESLHSGKALDVHAKSTADGGNIIQWTYNGGNNQQWKFNDLGNGYYSIINRNSGKSIDINGASTTDGANVIQWTYGGGYNQQFALEVSSTTTANDSRNKGLLESQFIEKNKESIQVYPNPSSTGFTIEAEGDVHYTIIDQLGRVAEKGNGQLKAKVGSSLSPGLYLIHISSKGEEMQLKLIKN